MRFLLALATGGLAAMLVTSLSTASGSGTGPRARWIRDVSITEYYPAPERWFIGRKVKAPGLRARHRVDWLYSSSGVSMEGDGVGLSGRRYHLAAYGPKDWVAPDGKPTRPRKRGGGWTHGWPAWRTGGWRNAKHEVTFPLQGGGWSNGKAVRYIKPKGVEFAPGPSLPLRPWRSIAADPDLIPLGSRVFVPAYCEVLGRGWFRADDTGSAINRKHIDVYRRPPAEPDGASAYSGRRIFVIPPSVHRKHRPTCADLR
jgi:3D (Asp-Asp-Asp) domain-containing protein